MAPAPPRSLRRRQHDTLLLLTAPAADAWVATASSAGEPHLVPLSLCWHEERIVLATETRSLTVRNLVSTPRARLAVGTSRDVVMVDAELERMEPVADFPADVLDAYAAQADWDPRDAGDGFVAIRFRPRRIQAWREANEIQGRTLMREGRWLEE